MSDSAYIDAVRRGDMETAQRMVDEAARAAGYTVGPVYHGTRSQFTEFDTSEGSHFGTFEQAKNRLDQTRSRGGDGYIKPYYLSGNFLRMKDVGDWEKPEKIVSQLVRIGLVDSSFGDRVRRMSRNNPNDAQFAVFDAIRSEGYDGVVYSNRVEGKGDSYMVLDPKQAKIADPITRDDAGNVIPLSKRFDSSTDDIRNPRIIPRQFPYEYAAYLKANFPEIWRAGGNIRGNDAFRWWTAYRRGDRSPTVMRWWNVTRPAWIARHYRDHRLPGVIAQIKWGTVGVLGVAGMKRVVEDAIRRRYAS